MPNTYPKECKKSISGPDDALLVSADSTHFDPYFPADNPELNDSSQIDISDINGIPNGDSTTVDLPTLIISTTDSYDDSQPHPERPTRVRFRSRVRITSGLNRHRHKSQQQQHGVDYLSFSPESSVSGSRSSSISAPLRTHVDEEVGKPGWGTLGQRVSLFTKGNLERRRIREQRERLELGVEQGEALINEQTPLLSRPLSGSLQEEASQMSREIEMVFGTWPGRLVNYRVSIIVCLLSIH